MSDARWIIQTPDRARYLRPDGQWDPDPRQAHRLTYPEARRLQGRVQLVDEPHAMIAGLPCEPSAPS